ncbi:MAG: fatty acid desaturase CarF family protein [Deltaproteobacteria bacterium]|mgnify:CR=1 FL=1|nr:fatty acid desaturase CarF family protein [Deltaproteobacteria bacterium]
MFPAAVLGYVLADIASGLAHWICDTFFRENTLIIGPLFIAPSRDHHRDPMALTRHGFLERVGNSSLGLIPLVAIPPSTSTAWETFLLAAAAGLLLTNLFHRWAHLEAPGTWITMFRRAWLILPRQRHQEHHRGEHRSIYCVTTGWSNAALEWSRFYRIAEWLVASTMGQHGATNRRGRRPKNS